jgi:hypothetical protein
MNDLEDRLRAELLEATAGLGDDVDPDAVLAAGRGARRARNVRWAAGATAVVAVAGLVTWSVAAFRPPVPGTPAPAPMATASQPSTSEEPVPEESTPAPVDPMSVVLDVSQSSVDGAPTYGDLTVSVVGVADDQVTVRLRMQKDSEPVDEREYTFTRGELWRVDWDKHLMVGITPEQVTWLSVEHDSDRTVYGGGVQSLSGIGASAFFRLFEESGGSATIRGFIWQRLDGEVRDSLGNTVPTARVTVDGDDYLLYRDDDLDVMGYRETSNGTGMFGIRLSTFQEANLVHGGSGWGDDLKPDSTWHWVQFGFLPVGAHDVSVDLVQPKGDWGVAEFDDGSLGLLAIVTSDEEHSDVIASLSYVNAAGETVSYGK